MSNSTERHLSQTGEPSGDETLARVNMSESFEEKEVAKYVRTQNLIMTCINLFGLYYHSHNRYRVWLEHEANDS